MSVEIRQLRSADVELMYDVSAMFGEVFDEPDTYAAKRPRPAYVQRLLGSDTFVALAALSDGRVVGGLAAYEFRKFEQERSEFYIYDLGVLSTHRRQGVATALIEALQRIAARRSAHVIFVQADTREEDAPAIALYEKLGIREEVLHFDIPVASP